MKLKSWLLTAQMAAFLAILSQFVLPLGVIPLTGQTFAVGLVGSLFSRKIACFTLLLYFLLGILGLPVFAGGHGGVGTFFGPTGGFLIGFLGQVFITSSYLEKRKNNFSSFLFGNFLGGIFTLLCGSLWLKFFLSYSLVKAFSIGFVTFIFPTLFNAFLAAWLGFILKKRLKRFF